MSTETKIVKKRWVDCSSCGGTDFVSKFEDELGNYCPPVNYDFGPQTRKTFAIVECVDCGLVFTNPMPNLDEHYEESEDIVYLASAAQRDWG